MQLKRQIFSATDNNYKVDFAVDNILNSKIRKKDKLYYFDRGCFYVLATEASQKMSKKLKGYWMKRRSFLLKCFNDKEPRKDIEHTNFHSMK